MPSRLGIMQGRLAPIIHDEIQRFPVECWEWELAQLSEMGFRKVEWTLDHEGLLDNPLMTVSGRSAIKECLQEFNISIPSVTADCVMQFPFWKVTSPTETVRSIAEFMTVIEGCAALGADLVVIPIVDNSSIKSAKEQDKFISVITDSCNQLKDYGVKIALESDYEPIELLALIDSVGSDFVGVNLDIGNSASLGFNAVSEITALYPHIFNVHLKDRKFGGTTVPFGQGDVDFQLVFELLLEVKYGGNFILQGARAPDGLSHRETIKEYCDFCLRKGFPND